MFDPHICSAVLRLAPRWHLDLQRWVGTSEEWELFLFCLLGSGARQPGTPSRPGERSHKEQRSRKEAEAGTRTTSRHAARPASTQAVLIMLSIAFMPFALTWPNAYKPQ